MIVRIPPVCVVAVVLWGETVAHAQSQTPSSQRWLDEAEVIRLVVAADPAPRQARARERIARAGELNAMLLPNPQLGWQREHLPGDGGESVDFLTLSVPIALSGGRAAQGALARARQAIATSDAHSLRSQGVHRALDAFYSALALQERVAILNDAVERLKRGATVLSRRHEEGAASGYERARIDVELELARSRWREAGVRASAARAQVAALLGIGVDDLRLRGSLRPITDGAEAHAFPSDRSDAAAAAHARRARDHAGSAWIPTVRLGAGLKIASAASTDLGYVANLSLQLPLSTPADSLEVQAGATAQLAEARAADRQRSRMVVAASADGRRRALGEEITALDAATADLLAGLERAAASGYREGRRTVVELLDAQRVRTRVALRRLELALAARQADIELRAARGEWE